MGKFFSLKKSKAKYKQMFDSTMRDYEDYINKILEIEKEKGKRTEQELKKSYESGAIGNAVRDFNLATYEFKKLTSENKNFSDIKLENNLQLVINQNGKSSVYLNQIAPEILNIFKSHASGLELALKNFKCKSKNKAKLVHDIYDKFFKATVEDSIKIFNSTLFELEGCYYTAKKDMKSPDKIKNYTGETTWIFEWGNWTKYKDNDTAGYLVTNHYDVFIVNSKNQVTACINVKPNYKSKIKAGSNETVVQPTKATVAKEPHNFAIKDGELHLK